MEIKKNSIVWVNHSRKGKFIAKAIQDFNTEKDEWYPLKLVTAKVEGLNTTWIEGEEIPCRANLVISIETEKGN